MKYKIFSIALLYALNLIFTGCSEDFLETRPIAISTTETFYTDFGAVDATCTAAYGELNAREVFDKNYYMLAGSIPSDDAECGGESLNDYPIAQHFDQFNHTLNDETPLQEIWAYAYKGLRHANTALNRLETVLEIDEDADPLLVAQRQGEMKFLRGLYHFMLVQVFGGVPIADKEIQPSDFETPRATIKEVFAFIENDLKEAIPALPTKSQLGASNIGRASKGAAQALLSKVLIYESGYAENYAGDPRFGDCQLRWQEALTYAQEVINATSEYSLVGANGERYFSWRTGANTAATIDGYRWLFTTSGDNSSESVFEIQSVADGLGYGSTHGNVLTVYQTVRNYTDGSGEIADVGGWSFNCPTQYLIAAFRNNDTRESNLNSSPGSELDDPRFLTTVGRHGDSILIDATEFVPMNTDNLPTGMIGRKFECGYDELWNLPNQPWEGPFNVRLIRLSDVLLLAAEAAIKAGDNPAALDYVNRVRSRARACGNTNFPQNLSAVTFEDIVHERRLELALEPHRFFDLVRWGLAYEFINGIPLEGLGGNFTVEFVIGKHEFFPLPLSEVEVSNGGLVQYDPWR
jgi:hypothetical protein